MNNTIATWSIPSSDLLAIAAVSRYKGVVAYRKIPSVLADGTVVYPTLRTAIDLVKGWVANPSFFKIPVVILSGSYDTIEAVNAREASALGKSEVFRAHCDRMGLVNGQEKDSGVCDRCGLPGYGTMYYSPDSNGYPTPILFQHDVCPTSIEK